VTSEEGLQVLESLGLRLLMVPAGDIPQLWCFTLIELFSVLLWHA
jgi:hypothetical protein